MLHKRYLIDQKTVRMPLKKHLKTELLRVDEDFYSPTHSTKDKFKETFSILGSETAGFSSLNLQSGEKIPRPCERRAGSHVGVNGGGWVDNEVTQIRLANKAFPISAFDIFELFVSRGMGRYLDGQRCRNFLFVRKQVELPIHLLQASGRSPGTI